MSEVRNSPDHIGNAGENQMTDEMLLSAIEQLDHRLTEVIKQLERINANLAQDDLAAVRREDAQILEYQQRLEVLQNSANVKYLSGRWLRLNGDGSRPSPGVVTPHDHYPSGTLRPPGRGGD